MKIFILIQVITSGKKSSLVSGNRPGKIFLSLTRLQIFCLKTHTHTYKQKAKQTKEEKRKTKKPNEKRREKMLLQTVSVENLT